MDLSHYDLEDGREEPWESSGPNAARTLGFAPRHKALWSAMFASFPHQW